MIRNDTYIAPFDQKDTKRIRGKKEKKERETKEGTESYIYLGKRRVLRLFLKGTRLVVDLIMAGRLFHRRG